MPHKIKAAFIGEGKLLHEIIHAVGEQKILPQENIILAENDDVCMERFADKGVSFCADEVNAVVKAEIVVVCAAKKRELGTILAPIAGCTRGRIVLAVCPEVDISYVAERVAKGTEILAVPVQQAEDGTYHTRMEFSSDFLPYQVKPCCDIIGSVCALDDLENP